MSELSDQQKRVLQLARECLYWRDLSNAITEEIERRGTVIPSGELIIEFLLPVVRAQRDYRWEDDRGNANLIRCALERTTRQARAGQIKSWGGYFIITLREKAAEGVFSVAEESATAQPGSKLASRRITYDKRILPKTTR